LLAVIWNYITMHGHMNIKTTTQKSGAFVQPLLDWKINKYYIL